MKRHKILEDLGLPRSIVPENYNEPYPHKNHNNPPDDVRLHKWRIQRKTLGFDERDTWNMDSAFACWVLERLIWYKENAPVDLEFNKDRYKGKLITQAEACDMMINAATTLLKGQHRIDKENYSWTVLTELWSIFGQYFWW